MAAWGVQLGNGDGTFQDVQNYNTGRGPESVAVADLNGDGVLDIVTANTGTGINTGGLSVLLGNGDGTFQTAQNVPPSAVRPLPWRWETSTATAFPTSRSPTLTRP